MSWFRNPPSAAAASSVNGAAAATLAFENYTGANSYWWSSGYAPAWLRADLGTARAANWYSVTPYSGDTNPPTAWTFEGSNDASAWTTLNTQSAVTFQGGGGLLTNTQTRTFTFTNTTAYRFYRLNISAPTTGPGGAGIAVSELRIGSGAPPTWLFNNTMGNSTLSGDYTIGVIFKPTQNGVITDFLGAKATSIGTAVFGIYNTAGTLLATASAPQLDIPSESQYTVPLTAPLPVTSGTYYEVRAYYPGSSKYITGSISSDRTYGDLVIPATGSVSFNGSTANPRYAVGNANPTSTAGDSHIVGVVFEPGGGTAQLQGEYAEVLTAGTRELRLQGEYAEVLALGARELRTFGQYSELLVAPTAIDISKPAGRWRADNMAMQSPGTAIEGQLIDRFTDQSGNNIDAIQGGAANLRPILRKGLSPTGLDVAQFTGTQVMGIALGHVATQTIAAVVWLAPGYAGTVRTLLGGNATGGLGLRIDATDKPALAIEGGATLGTSTTVLPTPDSSTDYNVGRWSVVLVEYVAGTSYRFDRNGVLDGSGSHALTGGTSNLNLGSGVAGATPFYGLVGEVIRWNRALTTTERADVQAELKNRWIGNGVTNTLTLGSTVARGLRLGSLDIGKAYLGDKLFQFPVTVAADDFNRVNATTLGVTPIGTRGWSSGNFGIQSNQLAINTGTATGTQKCHVDAGIADCTTNVTLSALTAGSDFFGVAARLDSTGQNGYMVQINYPTQQIGVLNLVAGTGYLLGSNVSYTPVVGDVLSVTTLGPTITVKINGVVKVTVTDSTWQNNTRFGVWAYVAGATKFENFSVGYAIQPSNFTPGQLSDKTLWLRAKDLTGSAGATVTSWTDQSGLAHHPTFTTNVNSGLNQNVATVATASTPGGGKSLRCDYTGISLPDLGLGASGGELWMVVKSDGGANAASNAWKFGIDTTSNKVNYYPYSGVVYDDFGTDTRRSFTPTLAVTSWRLYRVSITASGNWQAQLDNVTQLSLTGITPRWAGPGILGASTPHLSMRDPGNDQGGFKGNIAEVLLRKTVSTPAEAAAIVSYFNTEHGLAV